MFTKDIMSSIHKAINYGLSLVGVPYDYWYQEKCQTNAPMFAIDGDEVPLNKIKSIKSF